MWGWGSPYWCCQGNNNDGFGSYWAILIVIFVIFFCFFGNNRGRCD